LDHGGRVRCAIRKVGGWEGDEVYIIVCILVCIWVA
jgi:hypothetical protein